MIVRIRIWFIFAILLGVCTQSEAESQSKSKGWQRGDLEWLLGPSPVGIVAQREYLDSDNRVRRRELYVARYGPVVVGPHDNGTDIIEPVVIYRVIYYDYDSLGRITSERTYGNTGKLLRYLETHYTEEGRRIRTYYRADHTLRIEQRPKGKYSSTTLYFDESGTKVVALDGLPPDDHEFAWGPVSGPLMCGIGLNRESGPLNQLHLYVTVRNISEQTAYVPPGLKYDIIQPVLKDSKGNLVPVDKALIEKRRAEIIAMNPHFKDGPNARQYLTAQEAKLITSDYSLDEWFTDLPAGRYSLYIKRTGEDNTFDLLSNTITFTISQEGTLTTHMLGEMWP